MSLSGTNAIDYVILTSQRFLSTDTLELEFITNKSLSSPVGQYLLLSIAKEWRVYSIARILLGNKISILIKLIPGTTTTEALCNMKIGDKIKANFMSDMPTQVRAKNKVMLVCTGTGIIPCFNLAKEILDNGHSAGVVLFAGTRTEEGMLLEKDLLLLKEQYDHFQYYYSLTAPADDWAGYIGRLDRHLEGLTLSHYNATVYLAGYSEIMYSLKSHLIELEIPNENIHILGEKLLK